jgi:hypothetical protein
MEVHHHSPTSRRKWTHYFWEFLMLSLAVFCGFLAEYQLEHIIENQREEKYIKSFIEDLKADTMKINQVLQSSLEQQKGFDSLMGVLKEPGFVNNPAKFEIYAVNLFGPFAFFQTDRTLQQLKNAGGLRLIRKQAASDSIISYDNMVKEVEEQEEDLHDANRDATSLAQQIIDFNSFDSPFINRNLVSRPEKLNLLTTDPAKLGQFFNAVLGFKVTSIIYGILLEGLKGYAERLIIFFEKRISF